MDDTRQIILDSARRLFAAIEQVGGVDPDAGAVAGTWPAVSEFGLQYALLDSASGGFDLTVGEALSVVRLAGEFGLSLPLADTMMANFLLRSAGLAPSSEPLGLASSPPGAISAVREGADWRLRGSAGLVPWAHALGGVVAVVRQDDGAPYLTTLDVDRGDITVRTIAGVASSEVAVDCRVPANRLSPVTGPAGGDLVWLAGSALRATAMAGALARVMEITIGYMQDREQFGRPLSKFQTIQHELARIASQTAAAAGAGDIAADGIAAGFDMHAIAAAKSRVGEAAGIVAALSHQLHGAIGVTAEYRLQRFTRLLWQWRDEFGSESYWNRRLGEAAIGAGANGLWPFVTTIGESAR